jgi:hypothetical protein
LFYGKLFGYSRFNKYSTINKVHGIPKTGHFSTGKRLILSTPFELLLKVTEFIATSALENEDVKCKQPSRKTKLGFGN